MSKKVLLGMSGGVDSSVSAVLLQKEGYEVIGMTMKLWNKGISDEENQDIIDAKKVCEKLNIKHIVVDLSKDFKEKVIDDFINCYKNGQTPNPCIQCNKYMKFGAMFDIARDNGAEYIATGHYARVEYSDKYDRYVLRKSDSQKKDQSYVLYNIPSDKVGNILFPLAKFENKEEIRKIAEEEGLINSRKKDSQDICFIPDGYYKAFLSNNSDIKNIPGNMVTKDGKVLKKHDGIMSYTIGQRKGLGIGGGTVYYVTKIDVKKNEVVVGLEEDLYTKKCIAKNANLVLFDKLEGIMEVKAKIRYASREVDARIMMNPNGKDIDVEFVEKAKSVTPGQSIVFYTDDGIVIGGGIIKL